jgi:hypothetical protein
MKIETICAITSTLLGSGFVYWIYNVIKKRGEKELKCELTDSFLKRLPCENHTERLITIEEDVKLLLKLAFSNQNVTNVFGKKNSPVTLNSQGESLLQDLNGIKFLTDYKDVLFEKIYSKTPKTALDVEIISNEVLVDFTDNDAFISLKNHIYNFPSIK